MSVNPNDPANNQGVPTEAEIKKAEAEKAKAEAAEAKRLESEEAKKRTERDAAAKKKEEAAAKKAEKETSKEDVANVRTVGWEAEQARLEKEQAEAVNTKPAVEKFKGHKLEDRLDGGVGEEPAASDK